MNENDFSKAPDNQARPGNLGGSLMLGGLLFMERFCFYGVRTILYFFLTQTLEHLLTGIQRPIIYSVSLMTAMVVPILAGMIMDTLLEKRLGIILGAFVFGMGLLVLSIQSEFAALLGLSLMAVGSGFSKIGLMSYFGFLLPSRDQSVDGGYWLAYGAINLAAFLSGLLLAPISAKDPQITLVIMAVMSFLQAGLAILGVFIGLFPKESSISNQPARLVGAQTGGMFTMIGITLLCITLTAIGCNFRPGDSSLNLILFAPIFVLLVALGFVMLGFSQASGRSTALILGLAVLGFLIFGLQDIAFSIGYVWSPRSGAHFVRMFESLPVVITALAMGLVILLNAKGTSYGFRSNGSRLLAGTSLALLAALLICFPSFGGEAAVYGGLILSGIGEAIWLPAVYASGWRLAAGNRKGTVMGLLISCAGYGSVFGGIFNPGYEGDSREVGLVPYAGFALFGCLALLIALVVWAILRSHRSEQVMDINPFD